MIKTYEELISWMDNNLAKQVKPGLERVNYLLSKWGHPDKELKVIHIAGTNGKGSTLQFLKHLLIGHGKTVGVFTSPYFHKWNEQIEYNGRKISDAEIVDAINQIVPIIKKMGSLSIGIPSEFEVMTVVAFKYFAMKNPDYVIVEAGLGGRGDSTNVIQPIHTIITSIGLDHTNILGNTYQEIAFEKAGILKKNIPVVTGVEQEEAFQVIQNYADKLNVPLYHLGKDFYIERKTDRFTFHRSTDQLENIKLQMLGKHQMKNAALALQSFFIVAEREDIRIEEDRVRKSLFETKWKGRFEIVNHHPLVIMDGAHNAEGVATLIETLHDLYPNRRKHIIFSVMKDKPIQKMIHQIDHAFDSVWFTEFPFSRVAPASTLYDLSNHPQKHKLMDWWSTYSHLRKYIDDTEDVIVFAGSLYFISYVRESYLQNKGKN